MILLALAAGLGSRFGGPKQLTPLGPSGETLLDYALYDARRAGFERVVLIVRREMRGGFEGTLATRWRARMPIDYVFQEIGDLPAGFGVPAGRSKPWGTVQAVLAAAGVVDRPFAVINADDFYGRGAYDAMAAFLRQPPRSPAGDVPVYASVGFPLRETLTEAGTVNRALLRVSPDGWLQAIEEVRGLEPDGDGGRYQPAGGEVRVVPGGAPVSMNFWGFTPEVFPQLAESFRAFLAERGGDERAELLLADFASQAIRTGQAAVKVIHGGGPWCGVTYPEDRSRVSSILCGFADQRVYPEPAWG